MHPVGSRFTYSALKRSQSTSPSHSNNTGAKKIPAASPHQQLHLMAEEKGPQSAYAAEDHKTRWDPRLKELARGAQRPEAGATLSHVFPSTRCAPSSPIRWTTASRCVSCDQPYYGLRHRRQSCSGKGSFWFLLSHWHRRNPHRHFSFHQYHRAQTQADSCVREDLCCQRLTGDEVEGWSSSDLPAGY